MKDVNCVVRIEVKEALLIEKLVYDEYHMFLDSGYPRMAKKYLKLLLKIEKTIKGSKGYETHKFSEDKS